MKREPPVPSTGEEPTCKMELSSASSGGDGVHTAGDSESSVEMLTSLTAQNAYSSVLGHVCTNTSIPRGGIAVCYGKEQGAVGICSGGKKIHFRPAEPVLYLSHHQWVQSPFPQRRTSPREKVRPQVQVPWNMCGS